MSVAPVMPVSTLLELRFAVGNDKHALDLFLARLLSPRESSFAVATGAAPAGFFGSRSPFWRMVSA